MTTTTTKTIVIATMMHGRQTMSPACGVECEDRGHRSLVVGGGGDKEDDSKGSDDNNTGNKDAAMM